MNFWIWFLYCVSHLSICTALQLWSWSWPWNWFNSGGCKLKLNQDLSPNHEPLFFVKKNNAFELALPKFVEEEGGVLELSKGEQLIVACPGFRNELRGISKEGTQCTVSTCISGNKLHVPNSDVLSSSLDCKNYAFTTLKTTDEECGGYIGVQMELGFQVKGWHELVTLCFYKGKDQTLYARHILYGSSLEGAEIKHRRAYNFLRGPDDVFTSLNPESAYKQTNQRQMFTKLLGEKTADHLLATCYISRGHLAPQADFLLNSWQHLTFFYVNVAPQWQCINSGNWLEIESNVRHYAINAKADLIIYTGIYGILSIIDGNGIYRKLYLEPYLELLPVPEYFWKLIVDEKKQSCIVIFVYNNPFTDTPPPTICTNICKTNGWPDNYNIKRGFVFCCSYQDVKNIINYFPEEICNSVLYNEFM